VRLERSARRSVAGRARAHLVRRDGAVVRLDELGVVPRIGRREFDLLHDRRVFGDGEAMQVPDSGRRLDGLNTGRRARSTHTA